VGKSVGRLAQERHGQVAAERERKGKKKGKRILIVEGRGGGKRKRKSDTKRAQLVWAMNYFSWNPFMNLTLPIPALISKHRERKGRKRKQSCTKKAREISVEERGQGRESGQEGKTSPRSEKGKIVRRKKFKEKKREGGRRTKHKGRGSSFKKTASWPLPRKKIGGKGSLSLER